LSQYHESHFKIFNLCTEKSYDREEFGGSVEDRITFDDHNAPSFELLLEFCRAVDEYLSEDPENVIAVHCKAGKGRTGTVISCYLVWTGLYKTASDAMKFFGQLRTSDGHGMLEYTVHSY
jgi:phosphatidylinositol-3,4,5-trisphosphate 3-phosphatase/dual-specificity protein phosphatase PTEN